MATVGARMRSADAEVLALLGTFADQTPGGPSEIIGAPPDLAPIDECVLAAPPVESGEIWDSEGVLVAHSRQLALIPAAELAVVSGTTPNSAKEAPA